MNNFPFQALKLKDSVHFFKRGVKPVWEDRRNVRGGAWTFRIPKSQSEDFFREVLLMSIGEQFADALQPGVYLHLSFFLEAHAIIIPVGICLKDYVDSLKPGDDLCGISLSVRFNSNLISIWHRRADHELSKAGILKVVEDTISPELKPLCVPKNYYYKSHSEHAGFSEMVAKAREGESAPQADEGTIPEAEVRPTEGSQEASKVADDIGMSVSDI